MTAPAPESLAEAAPAAGSTASAPPVRTAGTRSRAGNAMARTRANLLDSALVCIEKYGARKTTMADIATVGRLAKATLYNHFRTKEALYTAAAEAEVAKIADAALATVRSADLAAALAGAAQAVSEHRALRRIAQDEPALLARVVSAGGGTGWATAVVGARAVLQAAGREPSDAAATTVVRWVLSHVGVPAGAEDAAAGAALLAAGLPAAETKLSPAG